LKNKKHLKWETQALVIWSLSPLFLLCCSIMQVLEAWGYEAFCVQIQLPCA